MEAAAEASLVVASPVVAARELRASKADSISVDNQSQARTSTKMGTGRTKTPIMMTTTGMRMDTTDELPMALLVVRTWRRRSHGSDGA